MGKLNFTQQLREYSQGAAMESIAPIANFLAPAVNVASTNGQFKHYDEKHRFFVPDSDRAEGGRASVVSFSASDKYFNTGDHAYDFPVDLNKYTGADFDDVFKEGADTIAQLAALSHERKTVNLALDAAGSGTASAWSGDNQVDPIVVLDNAVRSLLLAAAYGSAMNIGLIFGCSAWIKFKNNKYVSGKFVTGNSGNGGVSFAVPTEANVSDLVLGKPEIKTSMLVLDNAPAGKAKNMAFLMDTDVLVFTRLENPTRFDPSFMKTFRQTGKWMVPGTYTRDDGRVEVAKFDWSEDTQVCNDEGIIRLTIS